MLGFILFNMLFNENKSTSKGSKYIPLPPKSLIEATKKYNKKYNKNK